MNGCIEVTEVDVKSDALGSDCFRWNNSWSLSIDVVDKSDEVDENERMDRSAATDESEAHEAPDEDFDDEVDVDVWCLFESELCWWWL